MKPEYKAYLDELIEEERSHYAPWMRDTISRADLVRHKCQQFCEKFVQKFPHLSRQPGFVGSSEHWWLIDSDGTIVDPTGEQFGNVPKTRYIRYNPHRHKVHLFNCRDCGTEVFDLIENADNYIDGFCSEECCDTYVEYLTAGKL